MEALASVLEDPANADKTTEEISAMLIDALDTERGRTHRVAVVAQLSADGAPDGELFTVVLGPFTSRGVLDSPAKFDAAMRSSDRVRNIAGRLAWDARTNKGRGRFMLVPAFQHPTDAWTYAKSSLGEVDDGNPMNLLRDPPEWIAEAVTRWTAGLWAEEVGYGPTCRCGLLDRGDPLPGTAEGERGPCPVHPEIGEGQ